MASITKPVTPGFAVGAGVGVSTGTGVPVGVSVGMSNSHSLSLIGIDGFASSFNYIFYNHITDANPMLDG